MHDTRKDDVSRDEKAGPPAEPRNWEDEGDGHACGPGQVWQFRYHQHSNGTFYEQCRPMGGGTYSWRVV